MPISNASNGTVDSRNHEGPKPRALHLHAKIGGLLRIVADSAHVQAKRRVQEAPGQKGEDGEQRQRVIIERAGEEGGLAARAVEARKQGPANAHPLVSPGHKVEFIQEGMERHAKGEREHAEEDLRIAHAEEADQEGGGSRDRRGGKEDEFEIGNARAWR